MTIQTRVASTCIRVLQQGQSYMCLLCLLQTSQTYYEMLFFEGEEAQPV